MDSTDTSITMATKYPSNIIPMDTTDTIMEDTDTANDTSTWKAMDITDIMGITDIMDTMDITKYLLPSDNIR
ncbi:hypothetical protein NPIL_610721, partial [Nephila pilipes]